MTSSGQISHFSYSESSHHLFSTNFLIIATDLDVFNVTVVSHEKKSETNKLIITRYELIIVEFLLIEPVLVTLYFENSSVYWLTLPSV